MNLLCNSTIWPTVLDWCGAVSFLQLRWGHYSVQIGYQREHYYTEIVRAVSAALHNPNWGEPTLSQGAGPKFSPVSTKPPKKVSNPHIEIWSTREISEVGGLLKEKCLCITATLGPFESKIFTHYNCFWGALWKQSSLLIHYSCCWAPSKVRYFTHCSCYWGPLWKRSKPTFTLHLLL